MGPASSSIGARNIYAVLRARRSARTEAVVLQVPFRAPVPQPTGSGSGRRSTSSANVQPDTFASLALLLALAKSFRGAP